MALLCQGNASHACCVYTGGVLPGQQLQADTINPAELVIDASWLTAQSYEAAGKTLLKQHCLHDMVLTSLIAQIFADPTCHVQVPTCSPTLRPRSKQPALSGKDVFSLLKALRATVPMQPCTKGLTSRSVRHGPAS